MKPGQVIYDSNGSGSVPSMIKGVDVIIEGGDTIYVDERATRATYAGDIYISGGQVYKNTIGLSGYADAKFELFDADYGMFGNVFLGSRISNPFGASYTDNGIMRAGLVYVGYDFNDATNVFDSTNNVHPKGKASLNVSALTNSTTENNRDSTYQVSNGRALNIQNGDIVTNDAEAGWIEINLNSSAYLSGGAFPKDSLNLFAYNGSTNLPARVFSGSGLNGDFDVVPQWRVRYKVIGYTVHYVISIRGARWSTNSSAGNAVSLFITSANNLFATNPQVSLMPRPKTISANDLVYDDVDETNNIPFNQVSQCFAGNGNLILHQSPTNNNWPRSGSDFLAPIISTPLSAIWDFNSNRIWMYKSGASMFVSQTTSDYSDPDVIKYLMSNSILPLNGSNLAGTSVVVNNTPVHADIYVSGTYELDPQYWFK